MEAVKRRLSSLVFVSTLDYDTLPQVRPAEILFEVMPGALPKRALDGGNWTPPLQRAESLRR